MLVYTQGHITEVPDRNPESTETVWIHWEKPASEDIHKFGLEILRLHPLLVEDMIHHGQRPKVDQYHTNDTHALIVFYGVEKDLSTAEFCIAIGERFVFTTTSAPIPWLRELFQRTKELPDVMANTGTILHRILDTCVDRQFLVVDALESRLDDLERQVFHHPEGNLAPQIFRMKRKLHRVRRLTSEGRNVVGLVSHEAFPFTENKQQMYFLDVFDHASRIVDSLDAVRDSLSGLLDLQTAQKANRMNEIMKTLAIISTIFLPLSFIVGLYGMNFEIIPELHWKYGYLYVWCLMISVAGGFMYLFRKRGWW